VGVASRLQRDFYAVEWRNVLTESGKGVSEMSPIAAAAMRFRTTWDGRVATQFSPGQNQPAVVRNLSPFDNFAAAERYFAECDKLLGSVAPDLNLVSDRICLWVCRGFTREHALRRLAMRGAGKEIAKTPNDVVLKRDQDRRKAAEQLARAR
jgi:hypothetical protein